MFLEVQGLTWHCGSTPELAGAGLWFGEKGGKEHRLEARSSGLCPEPELIPQTWACHCLWDLGFIFPV